MPPCVSLVGAHSGLEPVGRNTRRPLSRLSCRDTGGFGLGLYGKLSISQAALVALVIYALQIVLSRLWLGAFQFGPVEWLWRMATYWCVLPLRKA